MSADQASAQNTTPEAAPAAASNPTSAPAAHVDYAAEIEALRKKLEAAEGKLQQSIRFEQQAREAKRKEAEEKAAIAAQQGEHKALAEERAKIIEDLKRERDEYAAKVAQYEPRASKWDSFEQREMQAIEARKASLPERWQKLLDRASDVDAKRDVLATFDAERAEIEAAKGGAKPPPPVKSATPAAAPAPSTPRDWDALAEDREALRKAIAADPKGWEAHVASLRGADRPLTTLDRIRALRNK